MISATFFVIQYNINLKQSDFSTLFLQIPEFIDLKRRLDLSLHFATVNYENMLLEVFLKANR